MADRREILYNNTTFVVEALERSNGVLRVKSDSDQVDIMVSDDGRSYLVNRDHNGVSQTVVDTVDDAVRVAIEILHKREEKRVQRAAAQASTEQRKKLKQQEIRDYLENL